MDGLEHGVGHGEEKDAVGHLSCSAQVPKERTGAAEFWPWKRITKEMAA